MVKKYVDGGASYYLWDTELVRKDSNGNIFCFYHLLLVKRIAIIMVTTGEKNILLFPTLHAPD